MVNSQILIDKYKLTFILSLYSNYKIKKCTWNSQDSKFLNILVILAVLPTGKFNLT